jgi:hypothetical protein
MREINESRLPRGLIMNFIKGVLAVLAIVWVIWFFAHDDHCYDPDEPEDACHWNVGGKFGD